MNRRRLLIRTCKRHGFMVQPAALQTMMVDLEEAPENVLDVVLEFLAQSQGRGSGILSKVLWQTTLHEWMAAQPTQTPTPMKLQDGDDDNDAHDYNDDGQDDTVGRSKRRNNTQRVPRNKSSSSSSSSSSVGKHNNPSFQVINAIDTPKWIYDRLRHNYECVSSTSEGSSSISLLLGSAKDKLDMMTERFLLVEQRIMAHDHARTCWFHQGAHRGAGTNSAAAKSKDKWTITSVDRLLGSASRGNERVNKDTSAVVLLGLLTRSPPHENVHVNADNGAPLMWVLQDMTGTVPLNFQNALVIGEDLTNGGSSGGSWIPENAMMLARGNFGQDDVFHVDSVALPPPPMAPASAPALSAERPVRRSGIDDGSVTLSVCTHVQLDQPHVVSHMKQVLLDHDLQSPNELRRLVLVLMGPFVGSASSRSSSSSSSVATALDDLALLLESYPNVAKYAQIVLVPSIQDSAAGGLLFPQPPLRASLAGRLQQVCSNLTLTTNPSRITCRTGQEVVLFNHSGLSPQYYPLQRSAAVAGGAGVWLPRAASTASRSGSESIPRIMSPQEQQQRLMCQTLLEQGHLLAPLLSSSAASSQPPAAVYWNLDHSFRLDGPPSKTPACIVLGLQSHDSPFMHQIGPCRVMCPGSLARESSKERGGGATYGTIRLAGPAPGQRPQSNNGALKAPTIQFHVLSDHDEGGEEDQ